MLSDVRNRIYPAEYRMELKRPDGVAYASLGYIDGILGRSFAFAWDAYDELNLEISKYVMQGHKRKKNPYWDLCRGDYIIEVSREPEEDEADRQRFIIAQVNTKIDDKDVKEIQAYSLEYEFVSKNLRDYTSMLDAEIDKPRKLVTKNENEPGILEDLLVRKMGCNWKEGKITGGWTLAYGDGRDGVGRLDEDVLEKARTFRFSEGTVYEFLTELQKSFRCIFQFDTMKKEISIYDITVYNTCPVCGESHYLYYDQGTLRCGNEHYIPADETQETSCTFVKAIYGRDSGLYMTEQNYIKTFGENIDHSQITTRLYAYGKDDISIQDADNNPAGKPYLEDFSYFRSREYMSQELLDALDGYETYLQEMQDPDIEKGDKSTIFQALLEQKKGQQKKLHDLRYGTVSNTDLQETLELMQKAVERARELFDKLMEELGVTVGSEADRKQREENLKAYREKIDEEFGVFDDKFIKGLFLKADGTGFESEEDLSRLDFENIKIDVEKFGYDALLELQKVYEARISALVEMANTVRENAEGETYLDFNVWQKENSNQELTDFSPELSLTERWKKGSRFLFAGVKKGSGSLGEVQVPSISQKEENWTTKKFDNYVATTYEVELLEDKNVVTWSGNGAGLKQIVPPGETAQPFEPEGDREISVELNGQPLIADYHYTLDRAKKTITRRGTNLYPVKDKIDKAVQEMEKQVTAAEEKVDWYAKKLEELNQKVSYEYYLGTLIETAQDEETRQRLRELPEEMNKFIKESVYTNTDIGVPDLTEAMGTNEYREAAGQLYTDAKNAFAVMWQPPVQFEIDIVNLWKIVSCQDDWNKLSLGDMVHIRHRDAAKKDYVVRVVGIDYDPDQNTLRVKFTNQDNLKTPDALVKELFKRTKTTNAALSLHQEQWNNAQNNAVEQILNHEWDAATQAVKAGDHQTVVIDNRGITVSSEQASLEGHEMRLMSGLLAFTDDGWQTSRTAISNGHVAAENVVGKLLAGKNLEIIANKTDRPSVQTFRVDGNGVYLSNGALTVEGPRDKNGKPLQDGNGIELTPEKGLVVTNQGNGFELCMNAAVGLYFKANAKQSYNPVGMSNPSSNLSDYTVMIDTEGNAMFRGDLFARRLFLQEIGGQNIITYIDGNKNDPKIDGKWIKAQGLTIYDPDGDYEFEVDGSTGQMVATNCVLTFRTVNDRNVITIDPFHGIVIYKDKDKPNEEKVFELDMNGEVRMKGTLHSSTIYSSQIYGTSEDAYNNKGEANIFPAMTDKSFNITQYPGGGSEPLHKFGVTVNPYDGSVIMVLGAGTGDKTQIGDITYRTGSFMINKGTEYTNLTLVNCNATISFTENNTLSGSGGSAITLQADKVYVHSETRGNTEEIATVDYVDENDRLLQEDIAQNKTDINNLKAEIRNLKNMIESLRQ